MRMIIVSWPLFIAHIAVWMFYWIIFTLAISGGVDLMNEASLNRNPSQVAFYGAMLLLICGLCYRFVPWFDNGIRIAKEEAYVRRRK